MNVCYNLYGDLSENKTDAAYRIDSDRDSMRLETVEGVCQKKRFEGLGQGGLQCEYLRRNCAAQKASKTLSRRLKNLCTA